MTEQPRASGLERFLNLFTVVRPGEAKTALLLALNVFMILMAYYILKTVREGLILGEGSAELKSYLSAGQVVLLAFVVPYYGRLVAKFPRMKLINVVTVFFISLSADVLPAGTVRHPARDHLFRVDRHLQPDGRRAVLVVRQRRVLEGGRGASPGHRGPGRVAGRGRRGGCRGSAHRAVRRPAVDADRRRSARSPASAHQSHRPRRARPPDARPARQASERRSSPERVRDGVQDSISAADGADDPAHQLDQHDRRVHPRQHRQGTGLGDGRGGNQPGAERGTNHRRFLREVFLAGERDRPAPPAVRRLTPHQVSRRRPWP